MWKPLKFYFINKRSQKIHVKWVSQHLQLNILKVFVFGCYFFTICLLSFNPFMHAEKSPNKLDKSCGLNMTTFLCLATFWHNAWKT